MALPEAPSTGPTGSNDRRMGVLSLNCRECHIKRAAHNGYRLSAEKLAIQWERRVFMEECNFATSTYARIMAL